MVTLISWFVLAYGFSNIMVYGSIFSGMRNTIQKIGYLGLPIVSPIFNFISELLSCMMCTSTWVGFFIGITLYSPVNQLYGVTPYISWFFDGLMASGAVWAINSIIEWFEENRPNTKNL